MRFVYTALLLAACSGTVLGNDSSKKPDCGAPFCAGGAGSAAAAVAEWRDRPIATNVTQQGIINGTADNAVNAMRFPAQGHGYVGKA